MDIEFDPAKNEANIAKHGLSFAQVADVEPLAFVDDDRFDEPRFRVYGRLAGEFVCVAGTMRGDVIRVISFRRAHTKEIRRHVE